MQIRQVTEDMAVSPQISANDMTEIAAAGFKSIICNRPDGEGRDQPAFEEIEEAAKAAGIEIAYQPIAIGGLSDADGAEFGDILDKLPKPALAYCKSGTRCAALWSLSQAGEMPADDILKSAAGAGFDLRGLAPRLDAIKAGKE